MARYIDADALIKCLKKKAADDSYHKDDKSRSQHRSEITGCMAMVDLQPTADVAPIVHGEWLSFDEEANEWYCSKCGNVWQLNDGTPQENCMNFCTNCGAKMD